MRENIDRVLRVTFSAELPDGFSLQRDVANADLATALVGIYLIQMSERAYVLYNHPDYSGWDGLKISELPILDDVERKDLAAYATGIETRLRSLDGSQLTPIERTVRDKSLFTTRAVKHRGDPPIGPWGSFELAAMHSWPPEQRPYSADRALLEAYNASMFANFREVNKGTLGAFVYNYETEFDKKVLEEQTAASTRHVGPEARKALSIAHLCASGSRPPLHHLFSRAARGGMGQVHSRTDL